VRNKNGIPLHYQEATPQGDVVVITKTRFYFFFNRPRTSVMPIGFSEFGRQLGFRARYNTNDPRILAEFHKFFVNCVAVGGFQPLLLSAKNGLIDFLPGLEHLRNYIIGFHA
jgi:hypothetical protein